MAGKFITVTNHKGGVGKTTTTYTLALGLAHRGYRVVMVDADAQATLTEGALGFESSPGFYNLIARNEEFKNILLPVPAEWYTFDDQQPAGEAFLIPGNGETRHIANSVSDPNVIRDKFAPLLDIVDYVLLDASPTESMLHPVTYMASDNVLHPTICVDWSLNSLRKTMQYVHATQSYRLGAGLPEIKTLGVVPTMYQQTVIQRDLLESLQEEFADKIWEPVSQRIAWAEAAMLKQPVFAYDPRSEAAFEAWRLVDQFEAAISVKV